MGLLDVTHPYDRERYARLVVALDELARSKLATLDLYAAARGISTFDAARRSLYRLKRTLARHGVALEIHEENGNLSANFGTDAIRELIEPDLRAAQALLEEIDARRQGRKAELACIERESEVVDPATISLEYRGRLKNFTWIARKHGIGKERVRRILVSTGPIRVPGFKSRLEARRPAPLVKQALEAADHGARLREIAAILNVSKSTARRFLRRHGRTLPTGRKAEPGRT
jgi:hypothetical protein